MNVRVAIATKCYFINSDTIYLKKKRIPITAQMIYFNLLLCSATLNGIYWLSGLFVSFNNPLQTDQSLANGSGTKLNT